MRAPDAVTFCLLTEEGTWRTAVVRGVFLEEVRGTAARSGGAESAGNTRLIVPCSAVARDPATGRELRWVTPAEYRDGAERADCFTLCPGGEQGMADSFFVPGVCEDGGEAARLRPDARRICRVAVHDRGGRTLRHWTVTAV